VHAGDVVVTIDPKDFETRHASSPSDIADSLASAASLRLTYISSVTTKATSIQRVLP